ncbi:MAG: phosphatidate cytidylyltransferase, partial [Lentisphaerae bacterium]|nr:phosphatidate cytidylyltransferase [Lentisphaerota bacterium]
MLKHRLMSGLIIVSALVLLSNYLSPVGIWLLLVVLSAIGQLEFYTMANKAGIPVFRIVGVVCGTGIISTTVCTIGPDAESIANGYRWENMVMLASVIAIFVRQFPQKHNDKPLETIACTLFGVLYVPVLFNCFTRLVFVWSAANATFRVSETGRLLILYLVLVVKSTDTGAYFAGRAFGRHKLFPRVSPNKSWEGLCGGIITAVLASWFFWLVSKGSFGVISFKLRDSMLLGLILAIVGVIGDMFESLVKRGAGVKDSGAFVPGMGGLLDVLDSLLFGAPALYA